MGTLLHPKSVLVDTNVWMYYLLGVQPRCEETVSLFELCARRGITLLHTPTTLKDLFYLIPLQARRDAMQGGERADERSFAPLAWACVRHVTNMAVAVPQSLAECELAWMLRKQHDDFEDNLLVAAAETSKADYIATYDRKLLEAFAPACVEPAQLAAMLKL